MLHWGEAASFDMAASFETVRARATAETRARVFICSSSLGGLGSGPGPPVRGARRGGFYHVWEPAATPFWAPPLEPAPVAGRRHLRYSRRPPGRVGPRAVQASAFPSPPAPHDQSIPRSVARAHPLL